MSPFEAEVQTSAPRARSGLYGALRRTLSRPGADRAVVVLSLILMAFSLDTGLAADDYIHQLMAERSPAFPGFAREPWDLFRFASPSSTHQLMLDGVLSWWDDPDARLMFLRPISSLTHYLDHTLWPKQGWLMHLHSLAWAALLFFGLLRVYRALLLPGWACALAMFLYALDDGRAWFVSWVAARNAVIATALSVWVLWLHLRARSGGVRWAGLAAPPLLLLALLGGEGAVAICGYLFAYALFLDRGSLWERARSLLPYAVVVVAWRAVYRALGYGAAGSGLYFDPVGDPLEFAQAFVQRAPILLFAQIGGTWSDAWSGLFAFPRLARLLVVVGVFAVAMVGYALWPLLRRGSGDNTVRFGVTGALIALIPACAAFSADRLLSWVAIGASIALAKLIATYFDAPQRLEGGALRALMLPPLMLGLVVSNAIIDPVFLASRARGNVAMRDILDRAHRGVPTDPSIEHKRVVYVNPAAVPLAAYIAVEREARGIPRPAEQTWLSTAETQVRIERVGPRSLRVRQRGGFLLGMTTHLLRDPDQPFEQRSIDMRFVHIDVTDFTADGRPAEIIARFDRPLDDPDTLWLVWDDIGYRPFTLPAQGESVTLPAADSLRMVFGDVDLPFDGRYPQPADPAFETH